MLRKLFLVTVLVNRFIFSSGDGCGGDPNAMSGCDQTCQKRCPNSSHSRCTCPEENSCECKDGYCFDTISYACVSNGCGGDPNAMSGCDQTCQKRCPNSSHSRCTCPEENSCECKIGFCFDTESYACVSKSSQNCKVKRDCPEALERFTDAVLLTTSKALKVYADSTCETGSISTTSSMFLLASFFIYAKGETRNEISRVLNLWNNEEIMCVASKINEEASSITGCAEFWAAPCIFANDPYPLTPAIKNTVDVITLDGLAKNINFAQNKQSISLINQIVAKQTRNRVQTAVPDNSYFDLSTELAAISALYLEGGWEIEFQRTNEVTQFRISPTESEPQTFMHQEAEYYYAHSKLLGAKVVQVNMCIDQLSVWILLPDCPFTEGAVIDKMAKSSNWYKEVKETMNMTRVELFIPLLDKIATVDSAYILQKATGIETIFNNKTNQLKGVIEGDRQVAVTLGLQTTYVTSKFKGNRKPGELPNGPKETMKADYPFAYMVFRFGRVYLAGTFRRAVA